MHEHSESRVEYFVLLLLLPIYHSSPLISLPPIPSPLVPHEPHDVSTQVTIARIHNSRLLHSSSSSVASPFRNAHSYTTTTNHHGEATKSIVHFK